MSLSTKTWMIDVQQWLATNREALLPQTRKVMFRVLCAAAITAGMVSAAMAKCAQVEITEMNWTSSQLVTAVASSIMEKGYGCTVKRVASTTVKAMASVAETGKPDIVTELWINSAPTYPALVEAGKVETLANVLSDGGVEGWWIPKYLADKHPELRTIDGILKAPKLVGGAFHNCPTGWGCRVINDNLAVAFALKKNGLTVIDQKSDETLAGSIASAFSTKQPWFGYYWAPTAILGKYPMVKVDVGPYVESAHACNKRSDCKSPG